MSSLRHRVFLKFAFSLSDWMFCSKSSISAVKANIRKQFYMDLPDRQVWPLLKSFQVAIEFAE